MSACGAKGEAGQLPSLCREEIGRGGRQSTPVTRQCQRKGHAFEACWDFCKAPPEAPEDGASIRDPEMGSLHMPQVTNPETAQPYSRPGALWL